MEEYILIIQQEANFQSRSVLIPKKEFLEDEKRRSEFETLKNYVKENKNKGNKNVPNVIIQNIIWERNEKGQRTAGRCEDNPATSIIGSIMFLVQDSWDPDMGSIADRKWLDKSISNFCSGFNHIKNYLSILKEGVFKQGRFIIKPEQITDSFLVLEADDGVINEPPVDTVEELLEELYAKYYNV